MNSYYDGWESDYHPRSATAIEGSEHYPETPRGMIAPKELPTLEHARKGRVFPPRTLTPSWKRRENNNDITYRDERRQNTPCQPQTARTPNGRKPEEEKGIKKKPKEVKTEEEDQIEAPKTEDKGVLQGKSKKKRHPKTQRH